MHMNLRDLLSCWVLGLVVWTLGAATGTYSKEYRRILEAFPLNLDPAEMVDAHSLHILLQTTEGLLTMDSSAISPGIAERWEISDDRKVYTFFLSPLARFSDGKPITTEDVIRSLEYVLQNSWRWRDIGMIAGAEAFRDGSAVRVSGLTKLSERVLKISIEKPFPPFLEILAAPTYAILPASSFSILRRTKVAPFISSGPYVLSEVSKKHLRLVKNVNYRRANEVFYDSVNYTIVNSKEEAEAGFIEGRFHDIWPFTASNIPTDLSGSVEVIPALAAFTWYLQFNLLDPQMKNVAFRQFISKHVDVDAFLQKANFPPHFKATGFIPTGLLGHRSLPFPKPKISDEKALKGCSKLNPCRLEVLYSYDLTPALESLFFPLKKFAPRLEVSLKKLDRQKWFSLFEEKKYSITFIAATASYFETYMLLKFLLDETYFPGINRKKIRPLLEKALATPIKGLRAEIYRQVEGELLKQYSIIPIFHGDQPMLQVRKRIAGYNINVLGFPHLKIMFLKELVR